MYVKKCYENSNKRRTIDIPIVLICDYTNNMLLNTLEEITNKFKENGYYCVTTCTETKSILYGCEYIPVDDDIESIKKILEALYYVYDCDVLILGINIINLSINSIKQLKDMLRIDQTIILVEDFSDESIMTLDNDIVVTKGNSKGLKNNYSQRVFDDTQISLLYQHLIQILI